MPDASDAAGYPRIDMQGDGWITNGGHLKASLHTNLARNSGVYAATSQPSPQRAALSAQGDPMLFSQLHPQIMRSVAAAISRHFRQCHALIPGPTRRSALDGSPLVC